MINPAIVQLESIISRLPKDLALELIDWKDNHIETLYTEVHTSNYEESDSDLRAAVYRVKSAAVKMSEQILKNCTFLRYNALDRDVVVDRYSIMVIR